jgi:septum site-determining protein MinD
VCFTVEDPPLSVALLVAGTDLQVLSAGAVVLRASNLGTPVTLCAADSKPGRAYTDAARRLCGAEIELTVPSADKKGFLNKLFGRRAS